jgi:hypothetical protein
LGATSVFPPSDAQPSAFDNRLASRPKREFSGTERRQLAAGVSLGVMVIKPQHVQPKRTAAAIRAVIFITTSSQRPLSRDGDK